jgi:hypothetical protein
VHSALAMSLGLLDFDNSHGDSGDAAHCHSQASWSIYLVCLGADLPPSTSNRLELFIAMTTNGNTIEDSQSDSSILTGPTLHSPRKHVAFYWEFVKFQVRLEDVRMRDID